MIDYSLIHILPNFNNYEMAKLNLDNVIHEDLHQQILNQIDSHIETLKNIKNHEKIYNQNNFKLNYKYDGDLINTTFRKDMFNYKDMRKLKDHHYRYLKTVGSKVEGNLIDMYSHLEDEYYAKLYLIFNSDL